MKQPLESRTDWERIHHDYETDAPIPFDEEDRAEGLYDPNDEEAVRAAWASGIVTRGIEGMRGAPIKLTFLHLSQDVLAFYKAKGSGWEAEVDRVLREAMRA